MRRWQKGVLVAGALLAGIAAAVAMPPGRRRVKLLTLRLAGAIPDLGWREVFRLVASGREETIDVLVESRNPFEALKNPLDRPQDVAAGAELFRARCSGCHAADGHGNTGPDLTRREAYRHGASDWALLQNITKGIPGTAMPAHQLTREAAWQLVAYVRAQSAPSSASPDAGPPDIAPPEISFERLRTASRDSGNWLTYSGSLDGQRHSRLRQIDNGNVSRLRIKWLFQLSTDEKIETTPLVVGTTMYLTSPPGSVIALDTRTGVQLWKYSRGVPVDVKACCGFVNRGLAILGNTLFYGTLDAHLLALDAQTGALRWDVALADYRAGYSVTGAPLAVDGKVIVGIAGGEFGIRGFLDAYDAGTGVRAWRFQTIPGEGQPGNETWGGPAWKTGGAPTWMTGSYDAAARVLYWAVGNPAPDFQGDVRPGDNLYTNSVLALDVDTGRLRWYYQFTPHDEHDWDATEILVLAELSIRGTPRKALLQANRNGFYYILDRESGAFLSATEFARQTWARGFDSAGRPEIIPESRPTRRGRLSFPGGAATNWWSPSYDPDRNLFYVVTKEMGLVFFNSPEPVAAPGQTFMGSGTVPSDADPPLVAVRALDASTGQRRWEYRAGATSRRVETGGLLSTAGGLVFGGIGARFFALDAASGTERWWINTGGQIHSAPITYLSEGRQQVTVAAGRAVLTFVLGEP